MRESIVAASKLDTKYAVMLIYASYCLSAVEAINNNQTDSNSQSHYKDKSTLDYVIAIVGSVVGVLSLMLAALKLYYQRKKIKEQKKKPMKYLSRILSIIGRILWM